MWSVFRLPMGAINIFMTTNSDTYSPKVQADVYEAFAAALLFEICFSFSVI